jgi:Ca2+-binding RTX toxin-like protein
MLATTPWSLSTVTTLWIKSVSEADFGTPYTLDGGAGNDFLIGVDGDILIGGAGFDEIVDHLGANQLFGDQGADVLDGTDGIIAADSTASIADYDTADTLNNGAGADTLIRDDGDTLIGGRGTDNFTAIRDFTRVQAAVQVVDFDVSEDVLTVSQNTSTDVIEFTFDTAQNGNRCRASSSSSKRIRCCRHTKHLCCVYAWCLGSCRISTCTCCDSDGSSVTRRLVLQIS